jgi:hypothetical protein
MAASPVVIIRPAEPHDAVELARRMRREDADEVEATGGFTPLEAILTSMRYSEEAWTATFDGEVAAMYGVARLARRNGAAWLLTSDLVERHAKTFWKACCRELPKLFERWDVLANAIDQRHEKAVRWARRLGFFLFPAEPYGAAGLPFHMFTVRKEDLRHV